MIIIKENGLAAYFEVNKHGWLNFYGIQYENQPFTEPDKSRKNSDPQIYIPVEIMISGANVTKHRGGKILGCTCPEYPSYVSHLCEETSLGKKYVFNLKTSLLAIKLNYLFAKGTKTVRTWTEVTNISEKNVGLEYVSSFALTGLASTVDGSFEDDCHIMTVQSGWSKEFCWNDRTFAELGYFSNHHMQSSTKFGVSNTGTWSTKEYFPLGCFRYPKKKKAILWQIESNTAWNYEIADSDCRLTIRLSGPSEAYNHWWKNLKPGQSFESVKAALSFGDDFDSALAEMTG